MIPESLQIGSVTWQVKIVDVLPDGSDDWGMCDEDTSTIYVVTGPLDVMWDTFIHEVRHGIIVTFGLRRKFKGDGEEDVIATETPILLQLFEMKIRSK